MKYSFRTDQEKDEKIAEMLSLGYQMIGISINAKKIGGGTLYFEKKKPDLSDLLRRIEALEAKIK